MIIPLKATVLDADRLRFQLKGLLVQPSKRQITHLVLASPEALQPELLAPVSSVGRSTESEIHLNCTREGMVALAEPAADQLILRPDTRVRATDGFIGHLRRFAVTPRGGHIASIMVQEGVLQGRKSVTLPDTLLGNFEPGVVNVKADRRSIGHLPRAD